MDTKSFSKIGCQTLRESWRLAFRGYWCLFARNWGYNFRLSQGTSLTRGKHWGYNVHRKDFFHLIISLLRPLTTRLFFYRYKVVSSSTIASPALTGRSEALHHAIEGAQRGPIRPFSTTQTFISQVCFYTSNSTQPLRHAREIIELYRPSHNVKPLWRMQDRTVRRKRREPLIHLPVHV